MFFLFRKESFHSSLPCHEKFSPLKKWPIDHQWIEQNFRQMRSEVYIVIVNVRTLYLTIAKWGRYLYEITINYVKADKWPGVQIVRIIWLCCLLHQYCIIWTQFSYLQKQKNNSQFWAVAFKFCCVLRMISVSSTLLGHPNIIPTFMLMTFWHISFTFDLWQNEDLKMDFDLRFKKISGSNALTAPGLS